MNYNIKVEPVIKPMTIAELPDGSLALVLDGEFKGELFSRTLLACIASARIVTGNPITCEAKEDIGTADSKVRWLRLAN